MWTSFMDMHSGGRTKVKPYEYIYIEAPEEEARVIFYNRFQRNPDRVTCTCCGPDYSIDQSPDLEQATALKRGCDYGYVDQDGNEKTRDDWYALPREQRGEWARRYFERADARYSSKSYVSLEEYMKRDDVLFIRADQIKPEERIGDVPEEGYIWR